jgi:DNA repair exonuclease SbcCD ATPase subunit
MPRTGITSDQVFDAAQALVREGRSPTVVAVRSRLGGGSPNNIVRWLAEWREQAEGQRPEALPPLPEAMEPVMRQIWGVAWQHAQAQLEGEREAMKTARKDIEGERHQMLAEIERLDGELEQAKGVAQALENERRAHDQTRAESRETQALAAERHQRIQEQEAALREARRQSESAEAKAGRMAADLGHANREIERLKTELASAVDGQRRARAEADKAAADLRVEAATLNERTVRVDELRELVHELRAQLAGK